MTMIGMARRIDQLGRVVVPAEFRKMLGIQQGDLIEMRVEHGALVLRKVAPECAICSNTDDLLDVHGKHLCAGCVREIRLERMPEITLV
jgi:transcriptional pleiotropic regulator of transition state genes